MPRKEKPVEFRRIADGFRLTVLPSELKGALGGPEAFEPYADYVARQLAPPAEPEPESEAPAGGADTE